MCAATHTHTKGIGFVFLFWVWDSGYHIIPGPSTTWSGTSMPASACRACGTDRRPRPRLETPFRKVVCISKRTSPAQDMRFPTFNYRPNPLAARCGTRGKARSGEVAALSRRGLPERREQPRRQGAARLEQSPRSWWGAALVALWGSTSEIPRLCPRELRFSNSAKASPDVGSGGGGEIRYLDQ